MDRSEYRTAGNIDKEKGKTAGLKQDILFTILDQWDTRAHPESDFNKSEISAAGLVFQPESGLLISCMQQLFLYETPAAAISYTRL